VTRESWQHAVARDQPSDVGVRPRDAASTTPAGSVDAVDLMTEDAAPMPAGPPRGIRSRSLQDVRGLWRGISVLQVCGWRTSVVTILPMMTAPAPRSSDATDESGGADGQYGRRAKQAPTEPSRSACPRFVD